MRPVKTRFRFGSVPEVLNLADKNNSQVHYAKGTPSHTKVCSDRLKADGFRVFFTPLFEVLFTFPSRYWFAIGLSGVFSLAGWAPRFRTGFHVSRPTQDAARLIRQVVYGIVTLFDTPFRVFLLQRSLAFYAVLQPRMCRNTPGLGCCAFARHYRRNHCCFLFLRVLRCFSSPRLPPLFRDDALLTHRVAPFGDPGVLRLFAPNPAFSQLITSFFASESPGIRRLPLFACPFFN